LLDNFTKIPIFQAKIGSLELFLGKLFHFFQKSPLWNILPVHDKMIFDDPTATPLLTPTIPLPKIWRSWPLTARTGLTVMDIYIALLPM